MNWLRTIGRVFDRLNSVLAVMGATLLILVMLSVSYNVATRYFFRYSTPGMFEIWEYSLLYMTFLGAAWLLRREGHVSMDIVLNHLKPRAQAMLNTVTSILGALMFLALTWYGAQATWRLFQAGTRIPGDLYPPQGAIVIIIPIGSFLLFIQFLRRTHGYFTGWRATSDKNQRL
jgi:TRAP-type C4-dicarboxylate transport system permease small subunit